MENFEIKKLISTFFNKKIYIIFAILLSITIGYFYTYYYVTPMYKSSTTMLLVKAETESSEDSSTITQSDIALNQKLISTYTQIIKSNKVLREVISNLNLSINETELSNCINVSAADNTEIIKLSVVNSNPELAATIANEIATVFSTEVKELYNIDNVSVIDKAEVPNYPYNINHIKDLLMSATIGISVSCAGVFVYYLFNRTIKLEEDVEEYTGLNVLTTIPLYNKNIKITQKTVEKQNLNTFEELITFEDSKSPIAECFRTLRTNLLFTQTEKVIKTILVTSGYMKEGKSWTSANMAVAFAKSNKKVLLIDTDMRKGRQHHIFKVDNNTGLSNCLANTELNSNIEVDNLSKYIKQTKIPNIHIMTSGNRPPNPSELISSKKMEKLLNILQDMYDIVILDGCPSMVVSDSIILSKIVDSTIIVTANKETKIETLQKLKKSLETINAKIGGVIINKMEISMKTYHTKYYYSDSSKEKEESNKNETQKVDTVNDIIQNYKSKIINIEDTIEEEKTDINTVPINNYNKTDILKIEEDIIKNVQLKLENLTLNLEKEDITPKIEELKQYIEELIKQENIETKIKELKAYIDDSVNKNDIDIKLEELKQYIEESKKQETGIFYLEEKIGNLSNKISEQSDNINGNNSDIQTLKEEIYNLQTLIASAIVQNSNNDEVYDSLENKITDILNKTELDITLKEKQFKNQETNLSKLEEEIFSIKQEIINMKELLKDNISVNNKLDDGKVVNIAELKENSRQYIKFLNKRTKEEYMYDIHKEIRSEDITANHFSQILNSSNTENVAN